MPTLRYMWVCELYDDTLCIMTHVPWNLLYRSPELGSHLHIAVSLWGSPKTGANLDDILTTPGCSIATPLIRQNIFGPWETTIDRFPCSGGPWKANYMGNQGSGYLLVYVLGRCLKERQIDMVVSAETALAGKAIAWPTKGLMPISGQFMTDSAKTSAANVQFQNFVNYLINKESI